jgi:dTDP-4-amino-4,6-dideoxygalactose transaminase
MLSAISRYGARWVPHADAIVENCRSRGQLIDGPAIAEFERGLEERLGGGHAVTASRGRMAFFHIVKALGLPPGSEIVFPALTFWVVPEMARAAGLKPVFADVDPITFNLDPAALERAITPATRAVVPTHVYGLPCDMDEILAIARARGLTVIEDCAHALGATYRGQPVGTLGDAALFSFQVLKPLNTFGGGAAYTRHDGLGRRLAEIARAEPWPSEERVLRRIRAARVERALMRPSVFSATIFPILWAASFFRARPDVYLWEKVRPLWPLPDGYAERYSNVQACVGLAALDLLDGWTETTRAHARCMSSALAGVPGLALPPDPDDRVHVYYQYCVYPPDRERVVRRSLRAGLDVEYHHMDVCPDLPLFAASRTEVPGARRTMDALQLPIHAGLDEADVQRVARRFRQAAAPAPLGGGAAQARSIG